MKNFRTRLPLDRSANTQRLTVMSHPNNGNVIPGPKFQDAEDMQGIEEFMIKGNEVSKYKIQGVAVYENNPDVYSVMTDGGTEISINPDELNWYTQPIHNAVLIGLDKSVGLKISENVLEVAKTRT